MVFSFKKEVFEKKVDIFEMHIYCEKIYKLDRLRIIKRSGKHEQNTKNYSDIIDTGNFVFYFFYSN